MKQLSIVIFCDESQSCKAEKRRAMQQEKLEQEWKPQEGQEFWGSLSESAS